VIVLASVGALFPFLLVGQLIGEITVFRRLALEVPPQVGGGDRASRAPLRP
jgi:hypothetical protein